MYFPTPLQPFIKICEERHYIKYNNTSRGTLVGTTYLRGNATRKVNETRVGPGVKIGEG